MCHHVGVDHGRVVVQRQVGQAGADRRWRRRRRRTAEIEPGWSRREWTPRGLPRRDQVWPPVRAGRLATRRTTDAAAPRRRCRRRGSRASGQAKRRASAGAHHFRSEGESPAYDVGEALGHRRGLVGRRGLDHHPHQRLGAGRAAAGPGRCRRACPAPRRPRRPARGSSVRSRVDAGNVDQHLRQPGHHRGQVAQRGRRCATIRCSTCRAVRMPSPVVAWSRMMMCPDCSPPRVNPPSRIASST